MGNSLTTMNKAVATAVFTTVTVVTLAVAQSDGSWEHADRAAAVPEIAPQNFEFICHGNTLTAEAVFTGPSQDPRLEYCLKASTTDGEYVACRPANEGPVNPGPIALMSVVSQDRGRVIAPFRIEAWRTEGMSFTRIVGTPVQFDVVCAADSTVSIGVASPVLEWRTFANTIEKATWNLHTYQEYIYRKEVYKVVDQGHIPSGSEVITSYIFDGADVLAVVLINATISPLDAAGSTRAPTDLIFDRGCISSEDSSVLGVDYEASGQKLSVWYEPNQYIDGRAAMLKVYLAVLVKDVIQVDSFNDLDVFKGEPCEPSEFSDNFAFGDELPFRRLGEVDAELVDSDTVDVQLVEVAMTVQMIGEPALEPAPEPAIDPTTPVELQLDGPTKSSRGSVSACFAAMLATATAAAVFF
eukprot:SAG31_NODE_4310_length_3368_cov_2.121750_1_plen_412_part_00